MDEQDWGALLRPSGNVVHRERLRCAWPFVEEPSRVRLLSPDERLDRRCGSGNHRCFEIDRPHGSRRMVGGGEQRHDSNHLAGVMLVVEAIGLSSTVNREPSGTFRLPVLSSCEEMGVNFSQSKKIAHLAQSFALRPLEEAVSSSRTSREEARLRSDIINFDPPENRVHGSRPHA